MKKNEPDHWKQIYSFPMILFQCSMFLTFTGKLRFWNFHKYLVILKVWQLIVTTVFLSVLKVAWFVLSNAWSIIWYLKNLIKAVAIPIFGSFCWIDRINGLWTRNDFIWDEYCGYFWTSVRRMVVRFTTS